MRDRCRWTAIALVLGVTDPPEPDVQEREVEMRDTVAPQILQEPRVTLLKPSRRGRIPRADLSRNRILERRHSRLHDEHGDADPVGRALFPWDVVGVANAKRQRLAPERTHDPDRPEPLEAAPLVGGETRIGSVRDVDAIRYGEHAVRLERADMLPDRCVQRAVRPHAVIVSPFLGPRLLPRRRERRHGLRALRILHYEATGGVLERHDVVPLAEQPELVAPQDAQDLVVGGHVVRQPKRLSRDGHELCVENPVADAVGTAVPFVPVVCTKHPFENRRETHRGDLGRRPLLAPGGPHRSSIGSSDSAAWMTAFPFETTQRPSQGVVKTISIDRAAKALRKNRSDFVLEAACREARAVLAVTADRKLTHLEPVEI